MYIYIYISGMGSNIYLYLYFYCIDVFGVYEQIFVFDHIQS